MAKYQDFLSRVGSNRDRAALRGIFSQFLTDDNPPKLKDLELASIVLSGAETTQITISGASTTAILLSGTATTGISITGATTQAISFGIGGGKVVDAAASLSLYGGNTTGDALVLQGSSADAGQKITITGATGTTIIGNVVLGASGTETVTFTAKLGSQLYSNLTGTAYTILKIHNHLTTAEIGGAEFKGEFINPSALPDGDNTQVGIASAWSYAPTGLTGAPAGVSANSNAMAIAPLHTVTAGNITGVHGEVQLQGTLNGATVNVAGVSGVISGAGANTLVLHMAGVASTMSTGLVNPTTGTLSYYLANSTTTVGVDNLLCMVGAAYITNFASFDAAATDKCAEANTNTLTLTPTSYCLRVLVAGNVGYIPVFDTKTWT